MSSLTELQFQYAELLVRRRIVHHDFDPEEQLILKHHVERSFPHCRVAAYFRSYRHLAQACGRDPDWRGHACETVKRLITNRVLVNYRPGWYGVNINFLEWDVPVIKLPENFDEQEELIREPLLKELLAECFVSSSGQKILTADNREPFVVTYRGRGTGPAESRETVIAPGETISPPGSSETTEKIKSEDWKKLLKAIDEGRVAEEFPNYSGVPPQGTVARSVPPEGTVSAKGTFPGVQCSPGGNTQNSNTGAALTLGVPPQGTFPYIASSASCTKASLAKATRSVPREGTPFDQRVELAWRLLQEVDTTRGLQVPRFATQWKQLCTEDPDYVLGYLLESLANQVKRDDLVKNPLAFLAKVARDDGRMRYKK